MSIILGVKPDIFGFLRIQKQQTYLSFIYNDMHFQIIKQTIDESIYYLKSI